MWRSKKHDHLGLVVNCKMGSFISVYGLPLFLAAVMVHCGMMSVVVDWWVWALPRQTWLPSAETRWQACLRRNLAVVTCVSAFCSWSSAAMIGAAKATGGLDNLHGYSKQGVLCVQCAMCGSVGIYSLR